jgi:hypothetical protein
MKTNGNKLKKQKNHIRNEKEIVKQIKEQNCEDKKGQKKINLRN